MPVESLQASASLGGCPQQCNNNGVCNSRGHCHCRTGFAPPFCDYPGTGGSEDSGPASDPNGIFSIGYVLIVNFLYMLLEISIYNFLSKR